jgi:hypothetical protein
MMSTARRPRPRPRVPVLGGATVGHRPDRGRPARRQLSLSASQPDSDPLSLGGRRGAAAGGCAAAAAASGAGLDAPELGGRHCPGRKPPKRAVKHPARPHNSPIQNVFS